MSIKNHHLQISGMLSQHFYLASHFYIPQQIIDRFDMATTSLIENGWFRFIGALETFWIQLKLRTDTFIHKHEFDFQPITLDEFYYPLLFYFVFMIGTTVIFICEILWNRIRRNCYRA